MKKGENATMVDSSYCPPFLYQFHISSFFSGANHSWVGGGMARVALWRNEHVD
jgi:hypothetical protein